MGGKNAGHALRQLLGAAIGHLAGQLYFLKAKFLVDKNESIIAGGDRPPSLQQQGFNPLYICHLANPVAIQIEPVGRLWREGLIMIRGQGRQKKHVDRYSQYGDSQFRDADALFVVSKVHGLIIPQAMIVVKSLLKNNKKGVIILLANNI
jgi:hypothetical protein